MSSPSLWGPVLGFGLLVASEVAGACPSCGVKSEESDLQKQFETARKAKDWTAADRLYPKLVAMRSNLEGVRDYLLYERGRCSEVLQMLDAERQQVSGSERIPDHSQMLGALVCEAARLEPSDRPKSMALLGEALDKEMQTFPRRSGLYADFASQPVLYLPAMRFLKAHGLARDFNGYAIQSQIEDGRTDNVRQLLEMGVDPNERHGGQHAAFGAAREALANHPAEALAIAKLLLEYGADPNMLVTYGEKKEPTTRESKEFDALLSRAAERVAAERPVRVDFADYEALPQLGGESYARFFVLNNTDKTWNLGFVRNPEGIEYSQANVRFEYVVWPGTKWRTYEWQDHSAAATRSTPVALEPWAMSLVRVPVSFYELMDAPSGLRLRLRIRASDGTDFVSPPFTLHDTTYVDNYWPISARMAEGSDDAPPNETKYGEPVAPLPRPAAIPAGSTPVQRRAAPHDRPKRPAQGSSR